MIIPSFLNRISHQNSIYTTYKSKQIDYEWAATHGNRYPHIHNAEYQNIFFWRYDFDHKKLINSGHYHYQCEFQIWDQSIQCILSCHIHIFLFQKQSRQICIKFQISEFHKDRFYVEQPINEQFYTNIEQPTKEDFHSKFH